MVLTTDLPEPFCGGGVVFTCTGTAIATVLSWRLDGSEIGSYTFQFENTCPCDIDLLSSLGGMLQVVNATSSLEASNSIDIISTLSIPNVTQLNGSSLHCQDNFRGMSNSITIETTPLGKS